MSYKETVYQIEITENGAVISKFSTLDEAEKTLNEYTETDKAEGTHEEGYYSIYQVVTARNLIMKEGE